MIKYPSSKNKKWNIIELNIFVKINKEIHMTHLKHFLLWRIVQKCLWYVPKKKIFISTFFF